MKAFYTPERIKLILFDLNHTLLDEQATFAACFREALREYTGRWEGRENDGAEEAVRRYLEDWKAGAARDKKNGRSLPDRRRQSLTAALQGYPIRVTGDFCQAFFAKLEEARLSLAQAFPETRETLERLSRSYRLAVLSNARPERLKAQLEAMGLRELFDGRLFGFEKDGFRKPHPSVFRKALEKTGIRPAQAVMVGNSWKNDIAGAARCGMDSVWLRPSHAKPWSLRKVGKRKAVIIRKISQLAEVFRHV
jgi:putative hydrolase of the HAD superfamily